MSTKTLFLLTFALGAALTACASTASGTVSPTTVSRQATTVVTTAATTSTREPDGAIHVLVRLPDDWSAATVEAVSRDFREVEMRWKATGPGLDVTLPGPGAYWFWAESPSSGDGLCFYQAKSDLRWKQIEVRDGDTVRLDFAGEVCA